jgi:hypothetical protein
MADAYAFSFMEKICEKWGFVWTTKVIKTMVLE